MSETHSATPSKPKRELRPIFRIVNALFWLGVYAGIVIFTDTWKQWVAMGAEAVIPIMLWMFNHIALRPHPPEEM